MYVTHLEACALTRQTAGTESRHTTLMGHLRKRVGLVHELRKRIGTEECIDYRRNRLRVNKVNRSEILVVTYVHTLTDGARHTCQTYSKLIVKLLAHSADTTVAQVVDIVDISLGVYKLDKVLDNGDYILLGKDLHLHGSAKTEFLIDTVTAHFAEVVTLFREEKVGDYLASRRVIRRLRVAQLPVYILDCLLL